MYSLICSQLARQISYLMVIFYDELYDVNKQYSLCTLNVYRMFLLIISLTIAIILYNSYTLHIYNLFISHTSHMCHINAYKVHISTSWHCRCSKCIANMAPYVMRIIIREYMQQMSYVISLISKTHLGFLTDDVHIPNLLHMHSYVHIHKYIILFFVVYHTLTGPEECLHNWSGQT